MPRILKAPLALGALVSLGLLPGCHTTAPATPPLILGGNIAGASLESPRKLSYEQLLKLPQVTYTVSDDSNFKPATRISGVPLDQLAHAVGAAPDASVAIAIGYDNYRSNFPADYIAAHHPMLVLKVNDRPPTESPHPEEHPHDALGPYLIANPPFTPSFKILSHVDEAQNPYGVVRIDFRTEHDIFGPIQPRGTYAADSPVMQGYEIASQNCFRCHNMGDSGGQLANRPWQILSVWAATNPKYFTSYVRNPQAINPNNKMPAFPKYDDATLEVLRAYFATFTAPPPSQTPGSN